MNYELPDPHPGRCKNHRMVNGHALRCLDYEDVPHRCSFPMPPQQNPLASAWAQSGTLERKPWVKP